MAATNEQVQQFVDERVRPRCEEIRALYLRCKDDKAANDDIYANLNNNPDWVDTRSDHPPTLLTPNDVLAWNSFKDKFIQLVEGTFDSLEQANGGVHEYPAVLQGCVRPPQG